MELYKSAISTTKVSHMRNDIQKATISFVKQANYVLGKLHESVAAVAYLVDETEIYYYRRYSAYQKP